MMTYAAITILTALVAATVWSIVTARRISAAFRKGRMLAESHGYGSDAMSQLGVSIIVSGLDAAEDIEQRLASEYWRYEVIVVLDSSAQALELARLQRKYSLILVNYPAVADITIEGSPLLYRSRQRRYRRLVVIDRRHRNPNDDLNCGINVASYEQIVPLDANTFLTDDAVRRLEVELNDSGIHSTQAVLFPVRPMSLGDRHGIAAIRRDAIVDAGGFDQSIPVGRMISRLHRHRIYQPLAFEKSPAEPVRNPLRRFMILMLVLCSLLLFASMARQQWDEARIAALLLMSTYTTGTLIAATALRLRLTADPEHQDKPLESFKKLLRWSFRVY